MKANILGNHESAFVIHYWLLIYYIRQKLRVLMIYQNVNSILYYIKNMILYHKEFLFSHN